MVDNLARLVTNFTISIAFRSYLIFWSIIYSRLLMYLLSGVQLNRLSRGLANRKSSLCIVLQF
jgi:hypothetical protein